MRKQSQNHKTHIMNSMQFSTIETRKTEDTKMDSQTHKRKNK